jgi:glycosyltransferase involved in cell wall biosynthesis
LAGGKLFNTVLSAFTIIAAQVPEAELWLLGDMLARQDRMTDAFRDSLARHPARERIHVPGKQSLGEIAQAIAGLNVFLFPMDSGANTRSSTLPVALGSGVPVVAVHGWETDPIFEGDRNVVFARTLSGEALAEAALRLHNDPALAERVGAGGRRLYEEHLSWPRIVDALLGVHES